MATVALRKSTTGPDIGTIVWDDWPDTARTDQRTGIRRHSGRRARELVDEIAPPLPPPDRDGNYPAVEAGRCWRGASARPAPGRTDADRPCQTSENSASFGPDWRQIDPTAAEVERIDVIARIG